MPAPIGLGSWRLRAWRRAEALRDGLAPLVFSLLAGGGFAPAALAAALPFEGTLRLQLVGAGFSVPASGSVTLNGSGGLGHLESLQVAPAQILVSGLMIPVTDPVAAPIRGFDVSIVNDSGDFARSPSATGPLQGAMPLLGIWRICLFAACPAALANLSVPLSAVGAGEGAVATAIGSAEALDLTVLGAAWTIGMAVPVVSFGRGQPTTTMAAGFAHGPASLSSSTAQPEGALQLVTPFAVSTNLAIDGPLLGVASLTLRFVPEPATFALVAGGLAALVAAAVRRRS
jgi:hypothetical protein